MSDTNTDSQYLRVTYQVEPEDGVSLTEVGNAIAREQSTGGQAWNYYRGERSLHTHSNWEVAADHQAVLLNPDRHTNTVEIGYPPENVAAEVSHLLTYVAGDAFGSQYVERMKVIDIDFPDSVVAAFPGPQHGIDGVKARSNADADRPLLGLILKPSLGLTPDRLQELGRCAIGEGVDLIKEDEKLVDPEYCGFEERLDAVVEMLRWMERETDNRILYVLNVTGRSEAFLDYVQRNDIDDVLDRFVLMMTVVSHGFREFRDLAEDDSIDCPMYAHRSGHAAYTRTDHGVSMRVFEKLFRLAGADFAHCGAYKGIHGYSEVQVVQNKNALVQRTGVWSDVKPTLPVLSGGITPGNIGENIWGVSSGEPETDVSIHLGGSVYALGETLDDVATAIRANRQAIDAALDYRSSDDVLSGRDEAFDEMRTWIREESESY